MIIKKKSIRPSCRQGFAIDHRHEYMVRLLAKPGSLIRKELTPVDCHLIHMVLGISGEAGELLDAVKKSVIYRKPIDLENVIEELGDLEFYMAGLRSALLISRHATLKANMAKLAKRYPGFTYSNASAKKRADKKGGKE